MSVAAIRCSRSPTAQPFPERLTHHDARDAPKASHFSQTAPRTAFPASVLSNPVSIPSALFLFQASCSRSEHLPLLERPVPIPSALFLLHVRSGLSSIPSSPFRLQPPYPKEPVPSRHPKERVPSRHPKEPVPSREPFPLHVRSARSAACPKYPFPSENVLYNKRGESRFHSSIDGGMPVSSQT